MPDQKNKISWPRYSRTFGQRYRRQANYPEQNQNFAMKITLERSRSPVRRDSRRKQIFRSALGLRVAVRRGQAPLWRIGFREPAPHQVAVGLDPARVQPPEKAGRPTDTRKMGNRPGARHTIGAGGLRTKSS